MSSSAANTPSRPLPSRARVLRPTRVNVSQIERISELAAGRIARVRDQIDFRKTGHLHLPVIGLDGDHVLEQRAGLGLPIEPVLDALLAGSQPAVDLARAD